MKRFDEIEAGCYYRYAIEPDFDLALDVLFHHDGCSFRVVKLHSAHSLEIGFVPYEEYDCSVDEAKSIGVQLFDDMYDIIHEKLDVPNYYPEFC